MYMMIGYLIEIYSKYLVKLPYKSTLHLTLRTTGHVYTIEEDESSCITGIKIHLDFLSFHSTVLQYSRR